MRRVRASWAGLVLAVSAAAAVAGERDARWAKIAPYFRPPDVYAKDLGGYRSPLTFEDGSRVKSAADWRRRREEILRYWHGKMGAWPALVEHPKIEALSSEKRESFTESRVRLAYARDRMTEGYLLMPEGKGPFPAVIVVYYEPETAVGKGKTENRDFAVQLARRGIAALSLGSPYESNYPAADGRVLQPLSFLAYAAANAYEALARQPGIDPKRIGITGHSYGGKWAMFASCLYEKFACGAWSDPGIVFDESRPNVNYWEPWYLGFERGVTRARGTITPERPRTGAYRELVAEGHDLHELHALMAPRPFLVSGGSEDPPERWRALNHSAAVNRLLGFEDRVAMTNRPAHGPTVESNDLLCTFFEWALEAKAGR